MTIKQQGGIFGRNPTFNDVEANNLDVEALGIGVAANSTNILELSGAAPIMKVTAENGASGFRLNVSGAGSNTLRVQQDGASKLELNGNNLKINSGSLQLATAGQGIDFSATAGTGTSELLDDYEEGSFTVEVFDAASGGNQSSTTTTGYYTKIGRQITITFSGLNNISTAGMTASNFLYISLPFTSDGSAGSSCGNLVLDGASFPAGSSFVSPSVSNNASRMLLRASGDGVADSPMQVQDFNGTTNDIQSLTVTYFE